jgi:hypothetical protein
MILTNFTTHIALMFCVMFNFAEVSPPGKGTYIFKSHHTYFKLPVAYTELA